MSSIPSHSDIKEKQPGKTWTVLNEDDGAFNITLPLGFGFIALLVLTAMGCGMQNLCRRRGSRDDDDDNSSFGYSVAISNTLLKEETPASRSQPPCMNCVLIEMGEMVCYTEKCPDCGRIPPGRRKKPKERFKRFRRLSAKKSDQKQRQQELLVAALNERDVSSNSDHFSDRFTPHSSSMGQGPSGLYEYHHQGYRGGHNSVV